MTILPSTSLKGLELFYKENKPLVFRYIVKKIKEGIESHSPRVEFWRFSDSQTLAEAKEENYSDILAQAQTVFISAEMYEDAAICRDLLKQIHN